ncbi:MAG: Rieske 2Fe-2S domain-containing protein, partial [Acidobacteriota bacterium]
MDRRSFLNGLLSVSGLALLGSMVYPVVHYLIPPEKSGNSVDSGTAAKVGDLKPNEGKIFKFGEKPGILIMTPQGEYRAFTAVCTHLGCTVRYRADVKEIW